VCILLPLAPNELPVVLSSELTQSPDSRASLLTRRLLDSPTFVWICLIDDSSVSFTTRIVELNEEESENLLAYLTRHVSENHDMQVRFRWSKNDVAIWDNRRVLFNYVPRLLFNNHDRCTFHTAT
jgi:hypothetical protein